MLSHQGCSCYILKAKLTLKPHHGGGGAGWGGPVGRLHLTCEGKAFHVLTPVVQVEIDNRAASSRGDDSSVCDVSCSSGFSDFW